MNIPDPQNWLQYKRKLFQSKNKKIGAITIRRTHRAVIYKQVNKTAVKKDHFNDEKTLETTIVLLLKNLGSGYG
jgi:hypothetical protein